LHEEYGMTLTDIWDMNGRNDKQWHSFADAADGDPSVRKKCRYNSNVLLR
jgi:hypothetical protein